MLTKHVQLPSKGMYYPASHPLHNKSTVQVKLFTAREQDILTDQQLAKSGQTVEALLQSIIVNKEVKPRTMLSGDRTAILIKSRQFSLGQQYSFSWQCPSCGNSSKEDINLSSLQYKGQPSQISEPKFKIVLPVSGKMLQIRLLCGSDQEVVRKIEDNRRKIGTPSATITTRLSQMIISVDGQTDPGKINRFVNQIPSRDSKFIRDKYNENSPDVNAQVNLSCKKCDSVRRMMLPITAQFFLAS